MVAPEQRGWESRSFPSSQHPRVQVNHSTSQAAPPQVEGLLWSSGTAKAQLHPRWGGAWADRPLSSKRGLSEVKVAQSCPTLCDPKDYTVHGILQARILQWVAVPFSRGSSQPRDWTQVSRIAGGFFTSWATREAQARVKQPVISAREILCLLHGCFRELIFLFVSSDRNCFGPWTNQHQNWPSSLDWELTWGVKGYSFWERQSNINDG